MAGKEHTKADKADDEATTQAQTGDGDPEQIQDRGADEEADAEQNKQVDGRHIDLAADPLAGHPLAQPQQQGGGSRWIDHGQQPEEGEKQHLQEHGDLGVKGGSMWKLLL